jgi:hypothetical protein
MCESIPAEATFFTPVLVIVSLFDFMSVSISISVDHFLQAAQNVTLIMRVRCVVTTPFRQSNSSSSLLERFEPVFPHEFETGTEAMWGRPLSLPVHGASLPGGSAAGCRSIPTGRDPTGSRQG